MLKTQPSGVIEAQKGGGMSIWLSNVGPDVQPETFELKDSDPSREKT